MLPIQPTNIQEEALKQMGYLCPIGLDPLTTAMKLDPCYHHVNFVGVAKLMSKATEKETPAPVLCPVCRKEITGYVVDEEFRLAVQKMVDSFKTVVPVASNSCLLEACEIGEATVSVEYIGDATIVNLKNSLYELGLTGDRFSLLLTIEISSVELYPLLKKWGIDAQKVQGNSSVSLENVQEIAALMPKILEENPSVSQEARLVIESMLQISDAIAQALVIPTVTPKPQLGSIVPSSKATELHREENLSPEIPRFIPPSGISPTTAPLPPFILRTSPPKYKTCPLRSASFSSSPPSASTPLPSFIVKPKGGSPEKERPRRGESL